MNPRSIKAGAALSLLCVTAVLAGDRFVALGEDSDERLVGTYTRDFELLRQCAGAQVMPLLERNLGDALDADLRRALEPLVEQAILGQIRSLDHELELGAQGRASLTRTLFYDGKRPASQGGSSAQQVVQGIWSVQGQGLTIRLKASAEGLKLPQTPGRIGSAGWEPRLEYRPKAGALFGCFRDDTIFLNVAEWFSFDACYEEYSALRKANPRLPESILVPLTLVYQRRQ